MADSNIELRLSEPKKAAGFPSGASRWVSDGAVGIHLRRATCPPKITSRDLVPVPSMLERTENTSNAPTNSVFPSEGTPPTAVEIA
jgi:hypothetical protein